MRRLVGLLGDDGPVPLFVLDAGYDRSPSPPAWVSGGPSCVVRIRSDPVFYGNPAPRQSGTRGRPRRHGRRIKLSEPKILFPCAAETELHDQRYGYRSGTTCIPGSSARWDVGELPPIVHGSVIRVDVEHTLAKELVSDVRLPWERRLDAASGGQPTDQMLTTESSLPNGLDT